MEDKYFNETSNHTPFVKTPRKELLKQLYALGDLASSTHNVNTKIAIINCMIEIYKQTENENIPEFIPIEPLEEKTSKVTEDDVFAVIVFTAFICLIIFIIFRVFHG
ncbi:MAG: hypothetical protein ACI4SB_04620 [Acutalibacteraceae bacterium]